MPNIEDQKSQIARLFEGVYINGIQATIRFTDENTDGRIDAIFEGVKEPMVPLPISFAIQEQDPEKAVIADILSQFVAPDELSRSVSSTVLEITDKTDSIICAFDRYSGHEITTSSYYNSPQMSIVKLSDRAMDRWAAAWIKYRIKNYEAPTDGEFGNIEDHPF